MIIDIGSILFGVCALASVVSASRGGSGKTPYVLQGTKITPLEPASSDDSDDSSAGKLTYSQVDELTRLVNAFQDATEQSFGGKHFTSS